MWVTSGYAIPALGLMHLIMFPTNFTLACDGLSERAADGSNMIGDQLLGRLLR